MSALLSSSSAALSGVESATPTLMPTSHVRSPPSENGMPSASTSAAAGRSRSAQPVDAFEQDGELVARQPRHGVGGAHGADQPLGHGLQQPIARIVAERVVDVLEVVEVEEHHGHVALGAAGERERVLDAIAEQVAVGEPVSGS